MPRLTTCPECRKPGITQTDFGTVDTCPNCQRATRVGIGHRFAHTGPCLDGSCRGCREALAGVGAS